MTAKNDNTSAIETMLDVSDELYKIIAAYSALSSLVYDADISYLKSSDFGELLMTVNNRLIALNDALPIRPSSD